MKSEKQQLLLGHNNTCIIITIYITIDINAVLCTNQESAIIVHYDYEMLFFFQGRILAYRLRAKTAPPAHPMGIRTPVRAELGGWERTVKVFSETIQ